MRLFARALTIATATLIGCVGHSVPHDHEGPNGAPCDRQYFVPVNEFPADERGALDQAVTRWNAIALEKFCLIDSGHHDEDHTISLVLYGGPEWAQIQSDFHRNDVIGVYYSEPDRIVIVSSLTPDDFEVVALHELGHAHSLEHTAAPAIMAPSVGSATDFTDIDMAECKRVGACAASLVLAQPDTKGGDCIFTRTH